MFPPALKCHTANHLPNFWLPECSHVPISQPSTVSWVNYGQFTAGLYSKRFIYINMNSPHQTSAASTWNLEKTFGGLQQVIISLLNTPWPCSDQSKMMSMCSQKPICTPPHLLSCPTIAYKTVPSVTSNPCCFCKKYVDPPTHPPTQKKTKVCHLALQNNPPPTHPHPTPIVLHAQW